MSFTEAQAKALYAAKWWEGLTPRQVCEVQLFEPLLCIPFPEFHRCVEESLGRPVWTHEFALDMEGLRREFLGDRQPPSVEEIFGLSPERVRVLIVKTGAT